MRRKLLGLILTCIVFVSSAFAQNAYGLPENIQDGNILHCFSWPLKDVKANLKNIAEAGFGAVQVSPLQRPSITSNSIWYDVYRPYDFAFKESAGLGTEAELRTLCEEAKEYGIKIIVDVVANHVDKQDYVDPWWKSNNDYVRSWGGTPNINYGNRNSITHDRLGDYAEVNSENADVIARTKAYVEWLRDAGVSGIRWDAAKHIGLPSEGCDFWKEVTSVDGIWHYGEILGTPGPNKDALMKEYAQYMSVTDSRYSDTAADSNNGIAVKKNGEWAPLLGTDKLVYWGESHDTYSNTPEYGGWSNGIDQAVIDRAYAAVACREGATALYLSRPKTRSNIKIGKGTDAYQSNAISEVNKFRNKMNGRSEFFYSDGNMVCVTRNNGGAVIVTKGAQSFSLPNGGGLCPEGTYTDRVGGGTFTVTSTSITGKTDNSGIAVIYNDVLPAPKDVPAQDFELDSDAITIYYDNSETAWTVVNCHYWGGETTTSWPGVRMTKEENDAKGRDIYILTVPGGSQAVFNANSSPQTVDSPKLLANHVYKGLKETDNGKHKLTDTGVYDGVNGITVIEEETSSSKVIYDMRGIRVSNPQPGNIYIVNGKKVIF